MTSERADYSHLCVLAHTLVKVEPAEVKDGQMIGRKHG